MLGAGIQRRPCRCHSELQARHLRWTFTLLLISIFIFRFMAIHTSLVLLNDQEWIWSWFRQASWTQIQLLTKTIKMIIEEEDQLWPCWPFCSSSLINCNEKWFWEHILTLLWLGINLSISLKRIVQNYFFRFLEHEHSSSPASSDGQLRPYGPGWLMKKQIWQLQESESF